MVVGVLALCALLWGLPAPVHAWTNAQVRSLRAEVELDARAEARVALALQVQVRGGWLGELSLAGFRPGLGLDPQGAVRWETEDGERLQPAVRTDESGITLSFDREAAPRRGAHVVVLSLTASFADQIARQRGSEGRTRLRFGFEGWASGLDTAVIVVRGPRSLRPAADEDPAAVNLRTGPWGSEASFTRLHLPREVPWEVGVSVASSDLPGFPQARPPEREAVQGPRRSRRTATGLLLSLSLLGSALLAGLCARRAARRQGRRPLFWPRMRWAREVLSAASFVAGGLAWQDSLWLSLSCYGLGCALLAERSAAGRTAVPLGRLMPVPRAAVRSTRWGFIERLQDAGTIGAVWVSLALLLLALAVLREPFDVAGDPYGLGLGWMLLTWTMALPGGGSRSVRRSARALSRIAEQVERPDVTLSLLWYVAPGASPMAPRLRISPRCPQPGLLSCEVRVDTRGHAAPWVVVLVTQSDSPADRWLRASSLKARRVVTARGVRAAHLVLAQDLATTLESLFEHWFERNQAALEGSKASARSAASA